VKLEELQFPVEQEEARAARRVASLLRSHTVTAVTGLGLGSTRTQFAH